MKFNLIGIILFGLVFISFNYVGLVNAAKLDVAVQIVEGEKNVSIDISEIEGETNGLEGITGRVLFDLEEDIVFVIPLAVAILLIIGAVVYMIWKKKK